MNGPLSSTSWRFWGYSNIGPCRCQRGIWSHYIMLSGCTMTCSIIWMASRELWLRRGLNNRNTCYLLWSWRNRSCPNRMPKWLQRWVWFSFLHISSILSRSCDCLGCRTGEWISILSTRHPILHNTWRPFWTMWWMNTVPNLDVSQSINPKAYRAISSSHPQWLQDLVNHPLIHMIYPAMMKNTWHLTM